MPIQPISWQSYQSRSLPYSAQRLVNLYFETAPASGGTKSSGVLFRRPGVKTFAQVGTGPIRGIHVMNGVPHIVSGKEVWTLAQDGTATQLPGDSVIGIQPVIMADNGSQVAIAAGGAGFIAFDGEVTRITDVGFRTVSSVDYQDAVFIWTETDTGRFFISPPFEGRGPYDPLDSATAEFAPDRVLRVFSDHDDLFLMGTDTVEPWFGSGAQDFPFAPNPGTVMEVGILAPRSVRKIDNSIMWLGSDERGGITVWRANGYSPQRVSTHALERFWETVVEIASAYAFTFRIEGHAFYVLTMPDFGTFVYDASTGLWSEWQTEGRPDWVALGFARAFGRKLTGNRLGNEIFDISLDHFSDDGAEIVWSATTPPVATENNAFARHSFVRVDLGAGVGLTTGQGEDPQIWLEWADEDGEQFGPKKLLAMGARGKGRTRAFRRRLGRARSRTYRVSGSDPVPLSLIGAYVNIDGGRW